MAKDNIFKEVPDLNYFEEPPQIDPNELKKTIESRRSVRVFTDEEISADVVKECIELALLAPNSSNLQPWEFIRVRSKNKQEELAKYCFGQPAASTAKELIVCVGKTNVWKKHCQMMLEKFKESEYRTPKSALVYYQKLAPFMYNQGPMGLYGKLKKVFLTLAGLFKVVPREPTNKSEMKTWAAKTCALACENLMLALRAYGLDSCPMEGFDANKVNKFLGINARHDFVVMILGVGKRSKKGIYGPRIRFDSQQFIKEI